MGRDCRDPVATGNDAVVGRAVAGVVLRERRAGEGSGEGPKPLPRPSFAPPSLLAAARRRLGGGGWRRGRDRVRQAGHVPPASPPRRGGSLDPESDSESDSENDSDSDWERMRRLACVPRQVGPALCFPSRCVTASTGLIRQTRRAGAGRLSWAGGSTGWTGPGRHGLPSQAARLRQGGAAAMKLGFAGVQNILWLYNIFYGSSPLRRRVTRA